VIIIRKNLSTLFYWKGLNKAVRNYVRAGDTRQRYKAKLSTPTRLLQPLPIPGAIWVDISLDFIEGLPKSRGKDAVLQVVDRHRVDRVLEIGDCVFVKLQPYKQQSMAHKNNQKLAADFFCPFGSSLVLAQ